MTKRILKIDKGVGISVEEDRMLAAVARSAGTRSRSRTITYLINAAANGIKVGEAPAELLGDESPKNIGVHYYVTRGESNKLSELCAYFGVGEKDVIRHLIRAYYAELPTEPTAKQIPLPEPVAEDPRAEFEAELLAALKDIARQLKMLNNVRWS